MTNTQRGGGVDATRLGVVTKPLAGGKGSTCHYWRKKEAS